MTEPQAGTYLQAPRGPVDAPQHELGQWQAGKGGGCHVNCLTTAGN